VSTCEIGGHHGARPLKAVQDAAARRLRHITHIGCHHVDGTCYVSLDGAAFGAAENCVNAPAGGNEFRFDNADTANGRRTYASLLAAFLSQRSVAVLIRGCSAQGVPSLLYFDMAQ